MTEDLESVSRMKMQSGGWVGAEDELLVARAELLGAVAVGEEAAGAPEGVGGGGVGADAGGHKVEDVVEERVGVDEHEPTVAACKGLHEVQGAPHAYQGFVRIYDCHLVPHAIRVLLQVMRRHSPPHLCIRAQQLLYHYRMHRHPFFRFTLALRVWGLCFSLQPLLPLVYCTPNLFSSSFCYFTNYVLQMLMLITIFGPRF
ncbi:uncharacterized protein DS421_13g406570 [Arachis hypogaea]|nr:uncharacterized protein DS421_13g406570 [Arachis hypogaea]